MRDLVERAKAGDVAAFGALVERFQDMAYGTAYAMLGDFHDAQDVTQEAFIQAWRDLEKLRENAKFPGWLYCITRNRCLDFLRRPRRETWTLDCVKHTLAGPVNADPAKRAERAELKETVLAAIRSLSEPNRLATTLFYINGYSVDEVAEFLEIPTGTVKRRLHDSRRQLKERMMAMVEDTLKSNALPENFSRKTVEKAVEEARKLNLESKFSEAEQVLRDALSKAPGHPGALRELNRSLMQGQVYGASRWDILPEVVEHGRAILASGEDDEYVYHELARTLLAIAAMPEAVEFIAGWIEKKGPNLERLGMLAWARGCVADYDAAESTWNELMALAQNASRDEIRDAVPQACDALVDCLSAAGEMSRAARVVKAGWDLCRAYGAISAKTGIDAISQWPYLFKQAGLETECILAARAWLAIAEARPEHHARVKWEPICARAWFDDPVSVTSDWLQWVRERIEARDWDALEEAGCAVASAFMGAGRIDEQRRLAQATRELLEEAPEQETAALRERWDINRFHAPCYWYVAAGRLQAAEEVAHEAIEAGHLYEWGCINDIAVIRGEPSPPGLMKLIAENDVDADYGAWYHVAREAAAAGDGEKAFDALRRACQLWYNPPLCYLKEWEQDTRWGALRGDPEFKRILDEKRKRIGPIHGFLQYFPGW